MKKLLIMLSLSSSLCAADVSDINAWSYQRLRSTEIEFEFVQDYNPDNDPFIYYLIGQMDAFYEVYRMTDNVSYD